MEPPRLSRAALVAAEEQLDLLRHLARVNNFTPLGARIMGDVLARYVAYVDSLRGLLAADE